MWAPFENKSPVTQFVHSFGNRCFFCLKKFLEIYKSFPPIPFSFNEYTATGARLIDEGTQREQSDLNSAGAFYHCECGDDSCEKSLLDDRREEEIFKCF